jgi:hypothetical protein
VAKKLLPKKPASKKAVVDTTQFPAVFDRLKAILTPYAPRMVVVKDDEIWYHLDTKFVGKNKRPMMFAATRVGKGYVSFYLMCVYCNPKFVAEMSPELKKRMQGKACFNFAAIDEELFAELEALTKTSAEWFLKGGLEKILKLQ